MERYIYDQIHRLVNLAREQGTAADNDAADDVMAWADTLPAEQPQPSVPDGYMSVTVLSADDEYTITRSFAKLPAP